MALYLIRNIELLILCNTQNGYISVLSCIKSVFCLIQQAIINDIYFFEQLLRLIHFVDTNGHEFLSYATKKISQKFGQHFFELEV